MKYPSIPSTALVLALALGTAQPALTQIQTAKVTGGEVRAIVRDGIASFKGIPFAAPPVGDLRWKPPQPAQPWTGTRLADTFGPAPMQDARFAAMIGGSTNVSEDCLYLNVWTPAKTPEAGLPVMVWIYGGAFMSGMTHVPVYDGARLAEKGVVFVSLTYRVGPFGFLAHPELSQESGKGSGCYGIQDLVAGLRWVRDNVAHFGGDPNRVTIFGESAGGIAVSMLSVVPSARGLFHRAISQSGGSMAPVKRANEAGQNVPSLALAEATGKQFLEKLGAADLNAARALSAEQIQKAGLGIGRFWPVADGEVIPGDQFELFEAGQFNDTPVLIGTNSDEGAMFVRPGTTPAAFVSQVRTSFGPAAEAILAAYPHSTAAEAFKSSKDLFRESAFAWHTWAWARLQTRKGKHPAFVYYFDHRTPNSPDGANHAAEIPYVFRNLAHQEAPPPAQEVALSDLMSSYWVNFAGHGDPNGPDLPPWPAFDPTGMQTLVFDEIPSARPLPNLAQLRAFDHYYAWRRAEAKASESTQRP
jgi:para-nitrobenzyl esterase